MYTPVVQQRSSNAKTLYFSKAFDPVPHKQLIYKLRQYGIKGIQSFLTGRRQRVVLRNGHSLRINFTSGVPQGLILGLLLFLLYVNDLHNSVKATAKMFADDTKPYSNISTLVDSEALQDDLNKLAVWSKTWLLNFNATKCVYPTLPQSTQLQMSTNTVWKVPAMD